MSGGQSLKVFSESHGGWHSRATFSVPRVRNSLALSTSRLAQRTYDLKEGDMYALRGEKHILTGLSEGGMHIICVFNPPVSGTEDHREADGVYPAVDDEGNQHFEYGEELIGALFKPPEVYRKGSQWCC